MNIGKFARTDRQLRALRDTGILTVEDLIRSAYGGDSGGDVVTVGLDKIFDVCNKRLSHITLRCEDLKTDPCVSIHGRRPDTMVTYRRSVHPPSSTTQDDDDDLIPPEWYCPLTHEIFVNPVVLSDGYTYEEGAIRQWIQRNNTSPMTGETLPSQPFLVPNRSMRDWITRLS